jgi:DNA-binding MarR family transcriptional regulator
VLRTTEQGRAQCEIFRSLLLDTDRSLTQNLSASEVDQLKLLLHKIYA